MEGGAGGAGGASSAAGGGQGVPALPNITFNFGTYLIFPVSPSLGTLHFHMNSSISQTPSHRESIWALIIKKCRFLDRWRRFRQPDPHKQRVRHPRHGKVRALLSPPSNHF
jgi:hypothetical protein